MPWKFPFNLRPKPGPFLLPPVHFQGITLLFALAGLSLGLYYSYLRTTTPTDQNWFTSPPSQIYISKPLRTAVAEQGSFTPGLYSPNGDSTLAGLFLYRAAGLDVKTEADLEYALNTVPEQAPIEVDVLDPATGKRGTLWIPRAELAIENIFVMDGVAMVVDVLANGASDRAGMRRGDLILQIDNRRFTTIHEAEEILRSVEPGQTLAYDIMRGVEVQRLYVTLARYGLPIVLLMMNVFGFTIWLAGLFVSLKSPENKAGRLVGWLFLSIAFLLLAEGRMMILDPLLQLAVVHTRLLMWSLLLAILIQLWLYFPKPRPDLEHRRGLIGVLSGSLVIIFQFLPALGKQVPQYFNMALPGLLTTAIILPIAWYVPTSTDLEYRKIGKHVLSVLFLMALLFIFLPDDARIFSLLLIPAAFFYAIGRYGLLDLDIKIRRNIQYWLVSSGWYLVLAAAFFTAFRFLALMAMRIPDIEITTGAIEILDAADGGSPFLERSVFMVFGMLLFLGFMRVGRIGQLTINRKYHRSNYDYRAANNRIHEIVSRNPTVEGLNREITRLLAELMLVRKAGIAVKGAENEHLFLWFHHAGPEGTSDAPAMRIESLFDYMGQSANEVRLQNVGSEAAAALYREGYSLVIPLWSRTRLYGIVLLGEKLSEDTVDQEDITFLNVIAHQLTVAYENAFLYEQLATQERLKHEMKLARQIQLGSLPQQEPDVPGLDVAGVSLPALEVGGDYYDYLVDRQKRLTVIVGDVSGKGTSAALYLSKVQGIIRTLSTFNFPPKELFVRTNEFLYSEIEKKSFVTAIGGRFDMEQRHLLLARAGHIPLYHFEAATGTVHIRTPRGMGMGMSSFELFERQLQQPEITFAEGDVFVFASDGVTELKNHRNEEFGEENLCMLIPTLAGQSACAIRDSLLQALRDFNHNGTPNDDQTLVVVKICERAA